ncbi:26S proteasome non-ATPase regulatory subunit 1 A-like protein [Cinnamomum micranthum f. kanehirae]|uniref:26S proteasome non-ATPase regulatory subunit 1 A-like protein n=1 Tax=Cinnamomum micranthum f. kanehirae TaxID=337451 RepID=A0A443P8Z1_9MAGN|nr:26S proteasome non-ATPase regulatory subunit 1 A-like protein [Cinnamomum micranthum f. kanehirae]
MQKSERQARLLGLFFGEVLRLLVKEYQRLPSPDYLSICQCLMFLDELKVLLAYWKSFCNLAVRTMLCWPFQIAFDLIENEHQAFLLNVRNRLPDSKSRVLESHNNLSNLQSRST